MAASTHEYLGEILVRRGVLPADKLPALFETVRERGQALTDLVVAQNLAEADLTGSSDPNDPTYGVPDGAIDAADFFYYLDLFVAGCP